MIDVYSQKREEKQYFLLEKLNELTEFHKKRCVPYKQMLEKTRKSTYASHIEDVPFLPVHLFKMIDFMSIEQKDVFKVLTSSGTTGQQVSKIFLDKETAQAQTKALAAVVHPILGDKRLPMIIVDTKNILKDRQSFSARGAGILGFSHFGRNHFYLLDENMRVDWDGLVHFLNKHKGEKILLFGFTFIVWKYFYEEAVKNNIRLDMGESVLVHGGGWKKLKDEAVSERMFKKMLQEQFNIQRVHNYYGMVEQVGSIFIECSYGHLHAPVYADIIVRDPFTFQSLPFGREGVIQVLSMLPKSYPGHSLLTEDIGIILGEDDCPCGWRGKYFSVAGRIPRAEVRGCSDTFSLSNTGGKKN